MINITAFQARILIGIALATVGAIWLSSADAVSGEGFTCDYATFFSDAGNGFSEAHMTLAETARASYGENVASFFGILGSKSMHEVLRANMEDLDVDMTRTPLVYADFESGRLHVSYCEAEVCDYEEILASRRECANAAPSPGAAQCELYAIRADDTLLCVLSPEAW
ncbi:hypothetical protein [Roseobacter weihaiensis]|uniref:hypothetical protein n=1 Tax=Roseobacter weihaiensis TaxID=2763262 RepID=UPI001D0B381F|nr:hypothetical protein [Roseobacter sp. H9]